MGDYDVNDQPIISNIGLSNKNLFLANSDYVGC